MVYHLKFNCLNNLVGVIIIKFISANQRYIYNGRESNTTTKSGIHL